MEEPQQVPLLVDGKAPTLHEVLTDRISCGAANQTPEVLSSDGTDR